MYKKNQDRYKVFDSFFFTPNEKTMFELINYSLKNDLDDIEILYLANGLANSGERIRLNKISNTCDIPSSGGPSSLSTLICPLFLKILGNNVLKLGVPGRPAGGIDVLAQISGYNINPKPDEINEWLNTASYVHFLANESFAPLDAKLFKYRKENNAVGIPSLVIASLLSKKLAVGLKCVGLDIRVSSFGNFGKTWDEARINGIRFNRVARLAGIQSKCFLTNGNIPQQPYIGRGEAILALNSIFKRTINTYLVNHLDQCFLMANSISVQKKSNRYNIKQLEKAFEENIRTQGGLTSSIKLISEKVYKQHIHCITSADNGYLIIDLENIRNTILTVQSKSNERFPDNCGVILRSMSNSIINKGDIICTFRCEDQYKDMFQINLTNSFRFSPFPIMQKHLFEEIN